MTEVDVEGIGTVRHLTMWQWKRIKGMAASRRPVGILAASASLSVQQFNRLAVTQQEDIRRAYAEITRPPTRPASCSKPARQAG